MRPRSCSKCNGDLYWVEDYDGDRWKCLQCGHEQTEIAMVEKVGQPEKRPYRKGPAFYARYNKTSPDQSDKSEYWEGYRQAVLDMSPK